MGGNDASDRAFRIVPARVGLNGDASRRLCENGEDIVLKELTVYVSDVDSKWLISDLAVNALKKSWIELNVALFIFPTERCFPRNYFFGQTLRPRTKKPEQQQQQQQVVLHRKSCCTKTICTPHLFNCSLVNPDFDDRQQLESNSGFSAPSCTPTECVSNKNSTPKTEALQLPQCPKKWPKTTQK